MAITKASSNAVAPAAKGDLVVGNATNDSGVLAVGSTDQVLTVDSSTATGLKWATAGGGGANWSLLNSGGTSLTGSTTTISGISGKDKIMILVDNASRGNNGYVAVRLNSDTGSNYYRYGLQWNVATTYAGNNVQSVAGSAAYISLSEDANSGGAQVSGGVLLTGCNSSGVKVFQSLGVGSSSPFYNYLWNGYYDSASTISSVSITVLTGTFDGGTVYVYASA